MKHYKNFKEAFAAANLDYTLWSPVVKTANFRIAKEAKWIQITIFQELKSPINWSSKLATRVEKTEFQPDETTRGFETIKFDYEYDED